MYNIYDFDGTIYKGDSSVDFLLYVLKKNKKLWKHIPKMFGYTLLHICKRTPTKKYKESMFSLIKEIPDLQKIVVSFWEKHEKKINDFFLQDIKEKENICVITASPEFLIKPYLDRFEDIKLIGTKMNKEGKIEGENCNKKEKVRRMYEWKKNIKINQFYSDSIKDTPLKELAKEAYIVNHGKIIKWEEAYFKKKKQKQIAMILFAFFFLFYTFLGIFLSYHFDFSENYDLLFNADSRRIIEDMSQIFGNHYRIKVHPLYVIMVQPFVLLLTGITADKVLSCILFSAVISSLAVVTLYKIASMIIKNNKINIILALFFGFTFTSILFAAGLEVYNVAGLFLLLLWYQTIKMMKSDRIEKIDYIYYVLLGVSSIGVTITNFTVFLITSFILWISKKIKMKKMVLVQIAVITLSIFFSTLQNYAWHNTPTIHGDYKQNYEEEKSYIKKDIKLEKIQNVIEGAYINSIVSSTIEARDIQNGGKMIYFGKVDSKVLIITLLFHILILYYIVKNFKKNTYINIGLFLTLLFNSTMHLFYGNTTPFLYATHFVYIFFLLFIINYEEGKYKKWCEKILAIMTILTLLINSMHFIKVVRIVGENLPHTYYRTNFATITLIIMILSLVIVDMIICIMCYYFLKKYMVSEEKLKYGLSILGCILLLELSFIAIRTTPHYAKILNKDLNIPIILEEKCNP